MKMYKVLFIAVIGLFVACDKEEVDNAAPEINIVNPVTESEFHVGDTIDFECLFTDNEQLKSYKIDIHWAGDHDHKSANVTNGEWQYEKTWEFESGQSSVTISHSEIVIPEHETIDGVEEEIEAGEYHFGVYCTDVAGNQSQQFIDIIIEHEDHDDHDHK